MLMFWIAALVMIVLALALLLPAFWGRYQSAGTTYSEQNIQVARDRLAELKQQHHNKVITDEEYQQQRTELEQTLALDLNDTSQADSTMLGDKRIAHVLALVFFIPVITFSLYFVLGSPEILLQQKGPIAGQTASQQAPAQHSVEEMVASLEQRLATNPDDAKGWMMLGRTYMSTQRYSEAANAFDKVIAQVGDKPSVLFAQADALAMAQGGRLSGKPAELVKKALKQNPDNVTGLWLAGLAEEEQGNDKQAIEYWRKAETLLINDPRSLNELRGLVQRAEARLKGDKLAEVKKTSSSASITVKVELAKALKDKVKPNDTVFIYARAVQGARMPLAIVKKKVSDLPTQILLTDQLAVIPDMTISKFSQVKIIARISRSGQATPQSGDLAGEVKQVNTTDSSVVNVTIDHVIK